MPRDTLALRRNPADQPPTADELEARRAETRMGTVRLKWAVKQGDDIVQVTGELITNDGTDAVIYTPEHGWQFFSLWKAEQERLWLLEGRRLREDKADRLAWSQREALAQR